jgi:hypothetical protein
MIHMGMTDDDGVYRAIEVYSPLEEPVQVVNQVGVLFGDRSSFTTRVNHHSRMIELQQNCLGLTNVDVVNFGLSLNGDGQNNQNGKESGKP